MNFYAILDDIRVLEYELIVFEWKHGIRSKTIYDAYINGEEPEDDKLVLDLGEWASVYKTLLSRRDDYRNAVQSGQALPVDY